MKRLIGILRATIVGGVLFLAPFVVLIIILNRALILIRKVVTPLSERLPVESLIGLETPGVLAFIILILVCLTAGLFARSAVAKKMVTWLEDTILSNLPGYSLIKKFSAEVAGVDTAQGYEAVLAGFDDAWQVGFLVERISEGRVVVFIPDAPNPWSGGVYIFNEDRVTPLDATSASVVNCLRKLGSGANRLLKGIEYKTSI